MSRPVRQRETYDRDITAIMGLAQAINLDPKADPRWKQETRTLIYRLANLLTGETSKQGRSKRSQGEILKS